MNDEPVFEATLTPYRSLGRTGFTVVMILAGGVTLTQIVIFAAARAWPVVGFAGLDMVLLVGAFWLSYRSGRASEYVQVSRTNLIIRKLAPSGRATEVRFNPFWTRFDISRHEEIGITGMLVSGQGRQTEIGSFLNPLDKESFASAFQRALATVKRR
ncbi:putative membrane protein [Hoeflea marina]|uniref:Putative membrane protein n=1 Tax=Hoeflea marina TaxID=274592 RepID=A0A317PMB4_9HYPH|nr:DUF2244 domain-containing protein [Hoeflea marina]PWW00187.1 putative membrane protein [Hoeflea marina]